MQTLEGISKQNDRTGTLVYLKTSISSFSQKVRSSHLPEKISNITAKIMRYSMLKAFRGLRLQKRMKVKKD
jgi:ribosomal protein S13